MIKPMNAWQRVVAKAYRNGAFAYLADMAYWHSELPNFDDTLFAHLMVELSCRRKRVAPLLMKPSPA